MSEPSDLSRVAHVPVTDTRPSTQTALDDARKVSDIHPTASAAKQVEIVGEAAARQWAIRTYGADYKLSEVSVPRRGTQGVLILDVVYEMENRASGELKYLVIEAKGGTSKLSDLTPIDSGVTWGNRIEYKQMSPLWFELRMNEMERRGQKELANSIRSAAAEGRLEAKVVTAPAFLEKVLPGAPKVKQFDLERVTVKDVSMPLKEFYQQQGTRSVTSITGRGAGGKSPQVTPGAASRAPKAPVPPSPSRVNRPVTLTESSRSTGPVERSVVITPQSANSAPAGPASGSSRGTSTVARSVENVRLPVAYVAPVIRLRRFVIGAGVAILPDVTGHLIDSLTDREMKAASTKIAAWLERKFQGGGAALEQRLKLKQLDREYRKAVTKLEREGPAWIFLLEGQLKNSHRWREVNGNYKTELRRISNYANHLQELLTECSNSIGLIDPVRRNLELYQSALFKFHLELENSIAPVVLPAGLAGELLGVEVLGHSQRAKALSERIGSLYFHADALYRSYHSTFLKSEKAFVEVLEAEQAWENPFIGAGGTLD